MSGTLVAAGQQLAISQGTSTIAQRPNLASSFDRTLPLGGADELFAKYFSEVTLDVVEEQIFQKRCVEEAGPRLVHLRQNSIGQVTIPPHIEPNEHCIMGYQSWTKHPKVDRTMFIMDRRLEMQGRGRADLAAQRHVPALRAFVERKNFGNKSGPRPLQDSFRAGIMNSARKSARSRLDVMDSVPH
mmetsp:Transcript_63259/g.206411  ORF Transcript_63259/g.206411 Transcript_63259/m.206411 type:complete len:186 (+) Transcript_63259:93-650(+)